MFGASGHGRGIRQRLRGGERGRRQLHGAAARAARSAARTARTDQLQGEGELVVRVRVYAFCNTKHSLTTIPNGAW